MSTQSVGAEPEFARRPARPTLCLDFDGVIHGYQSGWQGAAVCSDPPVPGAMAFIAAAVEQFKVAVYSSRSGEAGGIDAMREYIDKHLTAHFVENEKVPTLTAIDQADAIAYHTLDFPTQKPSAHVTLDDRAITFTGVWPDLDDLFKFKPWNKR